MTTKKLTKAQLRHNRKWRQRYKAIGLPQDGSPTKQRAYLEQMLLLLIAESALDSAMPREKRVADVLRATATLRKLARQRKQLAVRSDA